VHDRILSLLASWALCFSWLHLQEDNTRNLQVFSSSCVLATVQSMFQIFSHFVLTITLGREVYFLRKLFSVTQLLRGTAGYEPWQWYFSIIKWMLLFLCLLTESLTQLSWTWAENKGTRFRSLQTHSLGRRDWLRDPILFPLLHNFLFPAEMCYKSKSIMKTLPKSQNSHY
jgi:hypothetical protein